MNIEGKTLEQYIKEATENDPEFAEALERARERRAAKEMEAAIIRGQASQKEIVVDWLAEYKRLLVLPADQEHYTEEQGDWLDVIWFKLMTSDQRRQYNEEADKANESSAD